jgi:hypothetical protein
MRASVTARFGDTMIGVTHVAPDRSYCIGTARSVDLAIAGLTSFPIIVGDANGFMVRRPIGVGKLCVDDRVVDEVRLAEGTVVTFAFDRIALTIELVTEPAPLAKTALDGRPPKYIAGSLIVHLVVWAIAITFAQLPRAKKPRPPWVVHPVVARLAPRAPYQYPPPRHEVPPAPAALPPPSAMVSSPVRDPREGPDAAASPDPRGGQVSEEGIASFSPGYIESLHRTDQAVRDGLAATGPLYDEDDVDSFGGGQRKFDPRNRAGWGTIGTGRFKTISHGRGTGDEYRLPGEVVTELALCESPHCLISGALDKADVQHVIEPMAPALAGCVNQAALTLELDIAPNGHVKKAHAHGKIGRCAANVIGQLAFPAADGPTHATYTIGYP